MMNPEDLNNRRNRETEKMSNERQDKQNEETRQNEMSESLLYTPAFLREYIGRLMQVEFLIGTNNMVNKIGFLEDVGENYILLRSLEGENLIYADIYAIKFITISATCPGTPSFQNFNNNMNIPNMGMGIYNNINGYH